MSKQLGWEIGKSVSHKAELVMASANVVAKFLIPHCQEKPLSEVRGARTANRHREARREI